MTKALIIRELKSKGLKAEEIHCQRRYDRMLGSYWLYTTILDYESKGFCKIDHCFIGPTLDTLWWIQDLPSKI